MKQNEKNINHVLKIVMIGDNSVGKSGLIRRFDDNTFIENIIGIPV